MTLPLELGGIQDRAVRWAFEQIALRFPVRGADLANDVLLLAVTGTQRKLALGTGTWTWPGGTTGSSATTVTHGLPGTPVIAFAQGNVDQGTTEVLGAETFTYTATTFQTKGVFKTTLPAAAATTTFVWFAIG